MHQNTAMLEKSQSFGACGAPNTVMLGKSKKNPTSVNYAGLRVMLEKSKVLGHEVHQTL